MGLKQSDSESKAKELLDLVLENFCRNRILI